MDDRQKINRHHLHVSLKPPFHYKHHWLWSDSSLITRSEEADLGEHEQIFSTSDHDEGYNTRARSAAQQLAVFSPSSTVAVSLSFPLSLVWKLLFRVWWLYSGKSGGVFLVSRKGTRAGSACGRDEYSPREKQRQTCWYSWHSSLCGQG